MTVNFSPLLKLRLDSAEVPVVFPGAELTGQIVLLRDMHQDLERLEMTLTGRAIAKWWSDDQCYFGREKFIKEKFVVWETERVDGEETPPHLKPRMTTGGLPVYQTAGREWNFAIKWPLKEVYPPSTTPDGIFKDKAFQKCSGVFYKVKAKLFVKNQEAAQPHYMKTSMYFPCRGTDTYFSPLALQELSAGSLTYGVKDYGVKGLRRETVTAEGKTLTTDAILDANRNECRAKGLQQNFDGGEIVSLNAQVAKMRSRRRRKKKGGGASPASTKSKKSNKKSKAAEMGEGGEAGEEGEEEEDGSPSGGKSNRSAGQVKLQIENPFAIRDVRDATESHTIRAEAVPIIHEPPKKFCTAPWAARQGTEAALEDVTLTPSCLYLNHVPRQYSSEVEKRAIEKSPSLNKIARTDFVEPAPSTDFAQPLTLSFNLRNTSADRSSSYKKLVVKLTEVSLMMGQPVGSEMTEDDYQEYTLYPPIATKAFRMADESNDLDVLHEEWHGFSNTWTSRILQTHSLESSSFPCGDSQKVTIKIPDVNGYLNAIESSDTMRYRSFDEKERIIELQSSEPAHKGKNPKKKVFPFGPSSACSPICRVMHFISVEINGPIKEAGNPNKKSLFDDSLTQIGRIPITIIDKNVEDRLLWQKRFGLLLGHRATVKGGLLPKANMQLPAGVTTEMSPGAAGGDKNKKDDVHIILPGEDIYMRRNPLSSSTMAEGSEVAARQEKIAEARAKAMAAYEAQEEENRRIVAEKLAPPKGRKVSAAEDDEMV
eukprot:CAMPEP_0178986598 /NCGR_PEP_ID=MMETSP0795-20121207/2790_1 /TAXON_ID=88552 /ORGANISM="Amoebophrya sp., Strain Ameob2" /LENGTH=766 /DNA_ID=CAMNT_0020677671 /DNA_START=642 /DNA_END=2943 /DNA_ORIENTATION=+